MQEKSEVDELCKNVLKGNADILDKYPKLYPDLDINLLNSAGMNALHCATVGGHNNCVLLLLDGHYSADPNVQAHIFQGEDDYSKPTALHLAAQHGYIDVINVLLVKGADCNKTADVWVGGLVYEACLPLHLAALGGHVNAVRQLLNVDNVNAQTLQGTTALHNAVRAGSVETVALLLQAGADVWLRDNLFDTVLEAEEPNCTALHLAAERGLTEILQALLAHQKQDPDKMLDDMNHTALHYAVFAEEYETAIILIEVGANVSQLPEGSEADFLENMAELYGCAMLLAKNNIVRKIIQCDFKLPADVDDDTRLELAQWKQFVKDCSPAGVALGSKRERDSGQSQQAMVSTPAGKKQKLNDTTAAAVAAVIIATTTTTTTTTATSTVTSMDVEPKNASLG